MATIKYKRGTAVLCVLFMLCLVKTSFAQQDPVYSQYTHNPLVINPAYSGTNNMLSAQFLMRNQWVGFEGAPKTQTFSIHTPLKNYQLATGMSITNDELGPEKKLGIFMDFAYHVKLNRKAHLSMGIKAGFDSYDVDLKGLTITDPGDPGFAVNYNENFLPNFGVGLYYYTKKFYAGMSVPRFIQNKLTDGATNSKLSKYNNLAFYLTSGALFDLNKEFKLKPSVILKGTANVPLSLALSGHLIYRDVLWFGASYRTNEAVSMTFEYQINDQIRIGYSYDIPTSVLRQYTRGTHEITLAYDFRYNKKNIKTPRYF